jgi:hypothetical protein
LDITFVFSQVIWKKYHVELPNLEYTNPPCATTKSCVFECSKFNHIHFTSLSWFSLSSHQIYLCWECVNLSLNCDGSKWKTGTCATYLWLVKWVEIIIYLWSKVIFFVLFCHAKISQIMALHVTLLISLQSFQWVGVHQVCLTLFGTTVWKLYIIEPFSQWKLNQIKTENYIGIWKLESPWWVIY